MIGDSRWEMGEPIDFEPIDRDITYHEHNDGSFGTSIRCTACVVDRPDHSSGKTIHWQIDRLRKSNEAGVTQNEIRQEIYDNARRDGRDIQRVR